jgi:hypothetical protein|nr:MAG TPA: hypothetical protein [Caudoviricetes sp.]
MAGYPYYPQQPIINNPYGQIQPYQDRLAQLQNNYQQSMPYGQIQMQQLQPVPQSPMLQGQMVDGIDTVKAKDVDMSGNPVYYPKTDGTEIYRKQLQSDGRSKIFVYRLANPDEKQPKQEEKQIDIEAMFNQLRNDVCSEISEIKSMFPTQMSGTSESKQNGGRQR